MYEGTHRRFQIVITPGWLRANLAGKPAHRSPTQLLRPRSPTVAPQESRQPHPSSVQVWFAGDDAVGATVDGRHALVAVRAHRRHTVPAAACCDPVDQIWLG